LEVKGDYRGFFQGGVKKQKESVPEGPKWETRAGKALILNYVNTSSPHWGKGVTSEHGRRWEKFPGKKKRLAYGTTPDEGVV